MKKLKQDLAIHCHHSILVEYCYDYDERVKYIKKDKSESEQKIRLKVFKLLPKEATKDIPKYYQEADRKLKEADRKWVEADRKLKEADRKREEAYYKWEGTKSFQKFHQKWCGCSYWKKDKLEFN